MAKGASTDNFGSFTQDAADPGGFWHKNENKNPDAPAQPDYIGAARTQAQGSIGANIANNISAQNNVNSPLGKSSYNQIGSTKINIPGIGEVDIPRYEQNISLSPEQQQLYTGQTGLQQGLLNQAGQQMSQPFDMQSVQDVSDKAYGAMTSRLDPQWQHNEEMQKSTLANQGLSAGGEAYDDAMRVFGQQKNDAYQQANLGAIQTMPQTMQIGQQLRDMPLNEMNALKSGSPVNMPQFQPTQFAQGAQGPNTLAATQAGGQWQQGMYNSQVQNANAQKQGLMGLGSAALMFA